MHKLTFPMFALSALLSTPSFAVDAHHPEQKAEQKADAVKAAPADTGKTVQKMSGNLKKMQSQLNKLGKAKTPQERQGLLEEHMMTMQENMMMGHSMMGEPMACDMMGKGMKGHGGGMMGHGHSDGAGMAPEAMMNRMQMMEQRMDAMQMMLDQMKGQAPVQPMK